jgi:hypothetical protein
MLDRNRHIGRSLVLKIKDTLAAWPLDALNSSPALPVSITLMSEDQQFESARDQSRSRIGPPRGQRPILEGVIVVGLGLLIGIIAVLILHLML